MRFLLLLIVCLATIRPVSAQNQNEFCGLTNTSFRAGETITFKVYYNLGKLFVGAGEATFTCNLEKLNGRDVYHISGDGKTFRTYDWFFKVRDKYESFVDTASLQPLRFIRNVNEGGYKIYQNVTFNHAENTAVSNESTLKIPKCTQDVISAIYYARNINFDKYKPGDKIYFNMYLDEKLYNIYIRYIGKETVSTKFGKFRAIKFAPLLIQGTMFEGGEKMLVWVSDDGNKVPLRVDSPISVGSIKVDMVEYKNLRYNFTSLISK
ncbi:DUF3108 domain-containing protein [Chitinophaga pinensis]|uniref:DUF3108 domain-containing protein n=1 Tax=Chitinophaga pinensis (strain ATCC 43595 / DSM 2588 / LMG 13176 / NBRC 15968 / NCIMB 11800 / UQM 2034) TaxID=485918 RepID=A0A979GNT7_CHIPD|nr:DUF3108 domain-containing protein [Chitinophaga pinensis]ACU58743.1 hypothetical protein Cpin_1245 [Chitinophaga pinensis DSM 2588]